MRLRRVHILAIASLILVFLWVYGRFAPRLFFVLDDYIETEAALARPFWQALRDSFTGAINWSGYRPVSYAARATMAHAFRLDHFASYYAVILGLHLANTLLAYRLVWRVTRRVAWAFLAAAWLLLLPAHNEAVLYMSASANLFALLFGLAALDFSLSARSGGAPRWAYVIMAATAFALAVLAYEVMLALPLLVLLADWGLDRRGPRRNLRLYAALGVALFLVLLMRLGASQNAVARADYGISLDPLHLARGYVILLGQMVLLHSSPWKHLPLFDYFREWMAPMNPRALASMLMVGGLSGLTLVYALRAQPESEQDERRPGAPFWIVWGMVWICVFALPFAALAGRNPENRYTYIPAFGFAVAVAALVAWLAHRLRHRPLLRWIGLGLAVVALTFYAYVDTSDVSEWERASAHARRFWEGVQTALPSLPQASAVAQVGVPGSVGAAYVFTTDAAFDAAMRLRYGAATGRFPAGDLAARGALLDARPPVLIAYDKDSGATRPVDTALVCNTIDACRAIAPAATGAPSADTPWTYAQVYDEGSPTQGGLALLVEPGTEPVLRSCWAFHDLERANVDPSTFDEGELANRCRLAFDALARAGLLPERN